MYKYVLGKNRKHLTVSDGLHTLVKIWANEHGLTMVEATHKLLEIAFKADNNPEKPGKT
jgi:hypothetical protein